MQVQVDLEAPSLGPGQALGCSLARPQRGQEELRQLLPVLGQKLLWGGSSSQAGLSLKTPTLPLWKKCEVKPGLDPWGLLSLLAVK